MLKPNQAIFQFLFGGLTRTREKIFFFINRSCFSAVVFSDPPAFFRNSEHSRRGGDHGGKQKLNRTFCLMYTYVLYRR